MTDRFIPGGKRHPCPWPYPNDAHRVCGADATTAVQYHDGGKMVRYCLNHAQYEENFGHARIVGGAAA